MSVPSSIETLPPLREVIKALNLSARKSLGQNYLLDLNITRRIARAAGPLAGVRVVEIGPGPGGLTRALLLEGAAHVVVIERDERFEPALADIAPLADGRLSIILGDAMAADYNTIAAEAGVTRLVANLPYNIATPLIINWITHGAWPPWYDKLVVMVQLEVAERFVSAPGLESYGRLSVIAQLRTKPRILFTLPPQAFTPSPKVSSALVEIKPLPRSSLDVTIADVELITAAAFGQRRKMLRSSLASVGADTMKWLQDAGIEPTARAETLSVDDFKALARCLYRYRSADAVRP